MKFLLSVAFLSVSASAALVPLVKRGPAATKTFSVLSMNVAGLPEILQPNGESGDKTTNTMIIGQDLAKYNYDVIHVQEDFNYHATLYQYDNHPFRTATSGGVPFGSGLNTLANFDWIDFTRTKWATCSDASENDCLTPKGYTFMRLRLDSGLYVDFYNLHADAGTEAGDETARDANIQQVVDAIGTFSIGNPVIVFGDTNSRYTRSADNIRVFGTQAGLTDTWVQLVKGGVAPAAGAPDLVCADIPVDNTCETVDKILYRGSKYINLTPVFWNYETAKFLQPDGNLTTDHSPITTNFTWTLNSKLQQSDIQGGPHGDWYNDLPSLPANPRTASITLRGGSRLDAAAITLTSGTTFSHGGTGGTAVTLTLNSGEMLSTLFWCSNVFNGDTRIFFAKFTTSTGRTISAGVQSGTCFTYNAPSAWGIVGFFGQDGDEMDQFGVIAAPF